MGGVWFYEGGPPLLWRQPFDAAHQHKHCQLREPHAHHHQQFPCSINSGWLNRQSKHEESLSDGDQPSSLVYFTSEERKFDRSSTASRKLADSNVTRHKSSKHCSWWTDQFSWLTRDGTATNFPPVQCSPALLLTIHGKPFLFTALAYLFRAGSNNVEASRI